jgi:hypothetical protein
VFGKILNTFQQCCGSALVSMMIRIQLSMRNRIRIQGAKPMKIPTDPDPGHKKLTLYMKNILKLDNRFKNIPTKVQKNVFKAVNQVIC